MHVFVCDSHTHITWKKQFEGNPSFLRKIPFRSVFCIKFETISGWCVREGKMAKMFVFFCIRLLSVNLIGSERRKGVVFRKWFSQFPWFSWFLSEDAMGGVEKGGGRKTSRMTTLPKRLLCFSCTKIHD